jgi:ATP-dependent Clp protease, protease subunit
MTYYIPYVTENSGHGGERTSDVFSRLLRDRIIFIGTDISDDVANAVVAQLLFLKMEDPKKDVHIYIHSVGGFITAGLAIFDTMQYLGCTINTYCIGQCSAISALLLAAGTKGKRFALPNSRIMLHQPYGGVGGTAADVILQAKEILELKKKFNTVLAELTGQSISKVEIDSQREFYMSPLEAKDYGIIDEVLIPKKKVS